MNILQKIFTDHYKEIIYTLYPRKTEAENIDKLINFCNKYAMERTIRMSFKLINVHL